jgi:hypothetical protein
VFACPDLIGEAKKHTKQTLGTLPFLYLTYRKPEKFKLADEPRENWRLIADYAGEHWNGAVLPDEPEHIILFEDYVRHLDDIKDIRNDAAHTTTVTRNDYAELFRDTCQGGKLRIGALNALLLAWR